jgi:hypothetical protein
MFCGSIHYHNTLTGFQREGIFQMKYFSQLEFYIKELISSSAIPFKVIVDGHIIHDGSL